MPPRKGKTYDWDFSRDSPAFMATQNSAGIYPRGGRRDGRKAASLDHPDWPFY